MVPAMGNAGTDVVRELGNETHAETRRGRHEHSLSASPHLRVKRFLICPDDPESDNEP